MSAPAWPAELVYRRNARVLEVMFDDGACFALSAELLRVESPSAEVRGHGAADKLIVPGKRDVGITALDAIGNYAVRITFDDGHASGLYAWSFLRWLGENKDDIFAAYEAALAAEGKSRAP